MNIEKNFSLEHLFFSTRICRICNQEKDLLTDFYITRKNKGIHPSSYSYECKSCTIKRIIESRKNLQKNVGWEYPDW